MLDKLLLESSTASKSPIQQKKLFTKGSTLKTECGTSQDSMESDFEKKLDQDLLSDEDHSESTAVEKMKR